MNYRTLLLILPILMFIAIGVAANTFYETSSNREPAALALNEPRIAPIAAQRISLPPFTLTASAEFSASFRAVERDQHAIGYDADLAPTDFVVAWGAMSDLARLQNYHFSVSGRFFSWYGQDAGLSRSDEAKHLALLSLIPADEHIARLLGAVRRYDIVSFKGLIVEARHRDGWNFGYQTDKSPEGEARRWLLYVQNVGLGKALEVPHETDPAEFLFRRQRLATAVQSE